MKKITILSTLMLLFSFTESYADNMINNKTEAYVRGNIIQQIAPDSHSEINIGSIIGSNVRNTQVKAYVDGDIIVKTNRNERTILNIGSVRNNK